MPRAERIAFVCPRFAEEGTVGGAETLLKQLAERTAGAGREVTFLTTCARNHFTWTNELPEGSRRVNGMEVRFFPVDEDRDIGTFLEIQDRMSAGSEVTPAEERAWIENSVNSRALIQHLEEHGATYHSIVAGPYLFGLVYHAALAHPERTCLVPCLHDETFAYLGIMCDLFQQVGTCLFNTVPEQELAVKLYQLPAGHGTVVGMGLESFSVDAKAFARRHGIDAPYVLYSGRRETLKGTPLLTDYLHAFRTRTGRDVRLVFTGSGEIEAPSGLWPAILDAGFVSEEEKHEAMAGALAFCHPSVYESLGIVILEAWLAGCPCLVHARSKVLRYQCETSNGGLWFRNFPEFEEGLSLLLDHREVRDALGLAGQAYVQREYAWEAVEERLLGALDAG